MLLLSDAEDGSRNKSARLSKSNGDYSFKADKDTFTPPLRPCLLSCLFLSASAHRNLKNKRVTQCLTYLYETVTAADAHWHLIDLLMQLTEADAPSFLSGCFHLSQVALALMLKNIGTPGGGPGRPPSAPGTTMTSLAPSDVLNIFLLILSNQTHFKV